MNRATLLLPAALALANLAAAPPRPPVDPDAMAEATGAVPVEGYASSRAYLHYLEARLAEHRGDLRKAIEEMRLAAVYDPGATEVRLALGWLYAAVDDLDKAEVEAKRALALAPKDPAAHLLLGKLHAARHRRGPAEQALGAAIAAAPNDPEAYLALIQLYVDLGAERAARNVVARLSRVAPDEAEGYRILARAALDRGDSRGAAEALGEAARRDPWDFEARIHLGAIHERGGRHAAALEAYREILARDPDHEEALLGVARVSLAQGDDAVAREYVQRLVDSAPDGHRARKRAAIAYAAARRYREALALLDEATRLAPGDPELAFHRGSVLEDEGRFSAAAGAYGEVPPSAVDLYAVARARAAACHSREKRHPEAIRLLGEALRELGEGRGEAWAAEIHALVPHVYRRAGRVAEGLRLLEAAAARNPTPELLLALARSLEDAGRPGEAIARAREAYRQRPFDERFLLGLAVTLERNGRLDDAVELVQGALARDPDHAAALNFLGYVWADRGIRLAEARDLLERAARLRPDDGAVLDSLGWLLVRIGEAEQAVPVLERADALSPGDPVILDHLAEAYARTGRPALAIRLWGQALELLDGDPQPRVREGIEAKLREVRRPDHRSDARGPFDFEQPGH
jgi:tetratricopeptide (TPR) repeat protein